MFAKTKRMIMIMLIGGECSRGYFSGVLFFCLIL